MIENIFSHNMLSGLFRKKIKHFDLKAVHKADVEEYKKDGWEYYKKLKSSIQVRREKPHGRLLEDRVWCLFYKMGFEQLTGEGGGKLQITDGSSVKSQIDIVAIDSEVALVVECKSAKEFRKRPEFQEELGKFSLNRECFVKTVKSQFSNNNLKIVYLMFLNNINLTENDRERAKKEKVIIFDEKDLGYYENLVTHLGQAAKYQVLADMLPGREIAGLTIKLPAIKTKMGGYNCYTFSISPEYLLKISYVSHRAKGKASDINTYQRMLAKSRLRRIKDYISNDGIFPTNIVLNFEKGRLTFLKTKQEGDSSEDLDLGVLGWLNIRPNYKSAWIIDGQHRLFAYSGHEKALKSKLSVLAFEGLKPSRQAELFIDINSKQKRVKQSLLQELFAELHWDSEDPITRISAIISKTIQDLNKDQDCVLFQRIQSTDGEKDFLRCITISSLFQQLERKGFFVVKEKNGSIIEYGPLWSGDDNFKTLNRTTKIIRSWFNTIIKHNKEWWDLGNAPGGGIAMNDAVSSFIMVLKSVFDFIESKGLKLIRITDQEVCDKIEPYANALGEYLSTLDEGKRKAYRGLRGIEGMTTRMRQCQQGILLKMNDFKPDGLEVWIEEQKQETNLKAKVIVDEMEGTLQDYIVSELRREYGEDEDLWWYEGIPEQIRQKVISTMDQDKNKRGGKEYYFDLIHYRKIITENWQLFGKIFSYTEKGNPEKRTEWLTFVNEVRKTVSHKSSGKVVSIDEYTLLSEYNDWLKNQILKMESEEENDEIIKSQIEETTT